MRNNVAIFWDFENIHSSVMTENHGKSWYEKMGRGVQAEAVDIDSIMAYANGLGDVILNRAYCNWQWMRNYAGALNEHSVDLTQLFPRGRFSKNGADIALAVDIIEFIQGSNAVDTVIVVGGDSDFISVGKAVRKRGLRVIGIGVRDTTNPFWVRTCNEFKFYDSLTRQHRNKQPGPGHLLDVAEARELLVQAMQQQIAYYGEEWVKQVRIKPAMVRLQPSFSELDFGYPSFSAFLRDQQDLIQRRHREGEQEPEFRLADSAAVSATGESFEPNPGEEPNAPAPADQLSRFYQRVAGQQGVRMPPPDLMWVGIDIYSQFIGEEGRFATFAELDDEVLVQLREDFPNANLTDAKKIRQVLFKCYLFRPSEGTGIGFHQDVTDLADIEDRYFQLMLDRIAGNLDEEIDYAALSRALTGTEEQAARLETMDKESA